MSEIEDPEIEDVRDTSAASEVRETDPAASQGNVPFYFIPGYPKRKTQYRGRIRAHVLQYHLAERKSQSKKKKDRTDATALKALASSADSRPTASDFNYHKGRRDLTRAHDPAFCLSAARSDPFATFVQRSTDRENMLVDFYVGDLVNNFGIATHGPMHPPRDACFCVVIRDEACWYTMLSHSSRHLAYRQKNPDHTESRKYRAIALNQIHRRIQSPTLSALTDSTVMTIMGLLAYNLEFPDSDLGGVELDIQLEGLHILIKNFGGFPAFSSRPLLAWLINWFNLWSFGRLAWDTTPLSAHAYMPPSKLDLSDPESLPQGPVYAPKGGRQAMLSEEFAGLYGSMYQAAFDRHIRTRLQCDATRVGHLYEDESRFSRYVLNPTNANGSRGKIVALVYQNLLLYDHRDNLADFVSGFIRRFPNKDELVPFALLAADTSVGPFLWPMITKVDSPAPENEERIWTASRALHVYARLSRRLQEMTETALESFLRSEKKNPKERAPTPEQFRTLIMHDLGYEL